MQLLFEQARRFGEERAAPRRRRLERRAADGELDEPRPIATLRQPCLERVDALDELGARRLVSEPRQPTFDVVFAGQRRLRALERVVQRARQLGRVGAVEDVDAVDGGELLALEPIEVRQRREVLATAGPREDALEQQRQIGVDPIEAEEQKGARAEQLVDAAVAAGGERLLQRGRAPHDGFGPRRVAEQLEDEAAGRARARIARRHHRRGHAAAAERALDGGVERRRQDGAEGQGAEQRQRRRHILPNGDARELGGEAIAEPAPHVVGGHERSALEERPRLVGVGQPVEELADEPAQAAVGGEIAAEAQDAAAAPDGFYDRSDVPPESSHGVSVSGRLARQTDQSSCRAARPLSAHVAAAAHVARLVCPLLLGGA